MDGGSSTGGGHLFQVVRFGARPLLAMPSGGARLRQAAIRCYPAHSWKKVAVRSAMSAAVVCGLSGLLWRRTVLPLGNLTEGTFGSWLATVVERLHASDLMPVVVWPAQATRGRIYVHLLDHQGCSRGFAKLSLDQVNSESIRNECAMLERLSSLDLSLSRVPRILDSGFVAGHAYVVLESVPREARVSDWASDPPVDDRISEYAGDIRTMPFSQVEGLRWWQKFQEACGPIPAFAEAVRRGAAGGVEVCRVHGDLNQTNVLRAGAVLWLLDWEQSSEHGPCFTDAVCIEVDRRWSVSRRAPAASLRDFLEMQWKARPPEHHRRVLMALAFLCAAGFPPARVLVEQWEATGLSRV